VETITSLGYGDAIPKTTGGRVFGSIVALWGIILFAIPGAILGSGFVEVMLDQQKMKDMKAREKLIKEITSELDRMRQSTLVQRKNVCKYYFIVVHC